MKCPKCNAKDWRCPIIQSVNVEIDKEFNILDNGCDFTDPEEDKNELFCNNCGYKPHEEKNPIISHLKDILTELNKNPDLEQIKHNVYEIANHLYIDLIKLK